MPQEISPSSFRKFLEILRRGGNLKVGATTWQAMDSGLRREIVSALREAGGGTVCLTDVPYGTLLAYLSGWDDASEVVLRLPEAENVGKYPETPPEAATERETGQKVGSSELSIPETEAWDPVMDPLGPRNWPESPKN